MNEVNRWPYLIIKKNTNGTTIFYSSFWPKLYRGLHANGLMMSPLGRGLPCLSAAWAQMPCLSASSSCPLQHRARTLRCSQAGATDPRARSCPTTCWWMSSAGSRPAAQQMMIAAKVPLSANVESSRWHLPARRVDVDPPTPPY